MTDEEANFIKEQFIPEFGLRELSLIPGKSSEQYDKALMLDIYRNL